MNSHKEDIDNSALSANECTSKFDENESSPKPLNPVDFLIVTRIPMKVCKFQWIIRQFSILPKNTELYSTCIHVSDTSCHKLKLTKCEHGFDLFHVSQTREDSCGKNVVKNQNKLQSNEINSMAVSTGFFGSASGTSTFQFGSSSNETKSVFGRPAMQNTWYDASENVIRHAILPPTHARPHDHSNLPQQKEPKEAQNTSEFGIMRMEYEISATDSRGKELIKWQVCFSDDRVSRSCKIGDYINNTLEKFPDDSLILDCNLKVISTPTSEEMPIASEPSLECNGYEKLSKDFKALYQNSLDTDVTLLVGNEKICAHKLILTARSSIFDKIFHHDMKETERNSVTITDVQFSALQRLVEFLYSGDIQDVDNKDMDLKEIYDLYYAADKYQVMDLRRMAGNTLLGGIQVDNASELLIWADRHNDEDLKSRIMNFIRINFEEVATRDAWKFFTLEHSRLAVEVVNLYAKNIQNRANKV